MQDCRVARSHDQNPVCRGRPGEEKERNCLDRPGALAQAEGICDGPNGSNMQDCRVSRFRDQNPVCRGRPGEEKERNCLDRPGALAQSSKPNTGEIVRICDGTNDHAMCLNPNDMRNPQTRPNAASYKSPPKHVMPLDARPPPYDQQKGSSSSSSARNGVDLDDMFVDLSARYVRDEQLVLWTVTCTDRQQEDCQPICTESLTRGCTESRTPNYPSIDRHEGKYTHK